MVHRLSMLACAGLLAACSTPTVKTDFNKMFADFPPGSAPGK